MSEWISVEDAMPTQKDSDCNGEIWISCGGLKAALDKWYELDPELDTHWMPTGLTKPEPPQ